MLDRPSADRTAELLFWYARKRSRYRVEGRRHDAPRLDSEVILKLALGRPVQFADATWNEPAKVNALQQAACAYVRQLFFRPDPTPYQVLGLDPGASLDSIKECFRLLMQLVHPDRQGEKKRWPDACAAQANWAHSLLRDQETRRSFEEEADARAAIARAINRATMAAGATPVPVVVWPKKSGFGKEPFDQQMLPEWLTAGVGGYVRHHPAATAFGALVTVAALVIGTSLWEGRDGLLVRVARDDAPAPKQAVRPPMPVPEESVIATARPADPAPLRNAAAPAERPIVLASNAPAVALRPAPDDRAPASATPATQRVGTPSPSPSSVSSTSPSPLSSASAAAPALSTPAPPPVTKVDLAPAPQFAAKVDAAPAPEPAPMSVAIGAPPVAPPAVAPLPPATAEVDALFASFVDAYERGRLDAFAALFDEEADTNLRHGRSAIRSEYDELFRLSQSRRMQLTRMSWRPVGDRAVASGEINVKIRWRDGRDVEQRVAVDMELVRREGRVVIARLSHQAKNP